VPVTVDGEEYISESEMYKRFLRAETRSAEPFQERIYCLIIGARAASPKIFDSSIRIGTLIEGPLISVADLAARIGDTNYRRATRGYSEKYLQYRGVDGKVYNTESTAARVPYFTEWGVYRYLTQSTLAAAEPFQQYVYALAKADRLKNANGSLLGLNMIQTDPSSAVSIPKGVEPMLIEFQNPDMLRTYVAFKDKE
jgi:prophage antirepressor-like protein